MTQYRGAHRAVARRGRHRIWSARAVPRPPVVAAGGAVAAAVTVFALWGQDAGTHADGAVAGVGPRAPATAPGTGVLTAPASSRPDGPVATAVLEDAGMSTPAVGTYSLPAPRTSDFPGLATTAPQGNGAAVPFAGVAPAVAATPSPGPIVAPPRAAAAAVPGSAPCPQTPHSPSRTTAEQPTPPAPRAHGEPDRRPGPADERVPRATPPSGYGAGPAAGTHPGRDRSPHGPAGDPSAPVTEKAGR